MNYSVSSLTVLKKVANKIFNDDEDLEKFEQLLKLKDEKAKKEEQTRLERAQKRAIREQEAIKKALNKERKRKIKSYAEIYKTYKKIAQKEDRLELDGVDNVTTEGRRKFIEILIDLHNLEADISDKDIELVMNTFDMYPEIANEDNIKFLILEANKKGGLKSATIMIDELSNTLRYTKFYKPLIEYKGWVKKVALLPKIQEMKKQGINNTQIGERLGISSAEVSIILNNDKKPDFSGLR